MSAAELPPALSPEWRSWVVENLLRGADIEDILGALDAASVPRPVSQNYLSDLQRLPEFQGALRASRRGRQINTVIELPKTLYSEMSSLNVPRVMALTAANFYRDYYYENRPVHLPQFAADWAAYTRWTPEYLRDHFGQVQVRITTDRESDPDYDMHTAEHTESVSLKEYIELITSMKPSNDVYMVANNRNLDNPDLAPLMDDVHFDPALFRENGWRGCSAFWLGPPGTITPLHHDTCNIMFVQIYGRKRIRLFPPTTTTLLDGARAMYADLDPEEPGHRASAQMFVVDLEPGDALFLPVGWWHHVRALDLSISLAVTHFHPRNRYDWYVPGAKG